jgi:hypothetical protein
MSVKIIIIDYGKVKKDAAYNNLSDDLKSTQEYFPHA